MLQCISASISYVREGYWNDSQVANSSERIRAIFNNGVYAAKFAGEAKITKETLAATQHLILESQQKAKEAKLHSEKLAEDMSNQQGQHGDSFRGSLNGS
ncbi:hypothetical protein LWI29_003030 [Acer saccharum]|uniref:Uncharacterized protein n=1 Tax=Acer saccharum TaxID=4024 RepID=A0AA39SNA8_ACESA|nr:hypothetical protein LWI29_003030 [Acer saccharum]